MDNTNHHAKVGLFALELCSIFSSAALCYLTFVDWVPDFSHGFCIGATAIATITEVSRLLAFASMPLLHDSDCWLWALAGWYNLLLYCLAYPIMSSGGLYHNTVREIRQYCCLATLTGDR